MNRTASLLGEKAYGRTVADAIGSAAFRRLLSWPLFALTAAVALAPPTVAAQSWPNQDVKIVHPFSSGGASDFTARLVAQRLSEIFGHLFIVENRPGAAGTVAAAEVARAAADGHTLLWATTSPIAIAPMLRNQQYDPKTDLLPISAVTTQAFGLTVHPSVPARSVADFVTHVRAHPGSFSYAVSRDQRWADTSIARCPNDARSRLSSASNFNMERFNGALRHSFTHCGSARGRDSVNCQRSGICRKPFELRNDPIGQFAKRVRGDDLC